MSRQPTISTDSVAQDQIRAFVDRILRMKEEAKAINDDIREIYAEAKGNGFDKTVLGQVVSYVEKRSKDNAALLEREALFDLYMEAFDGGSSHARARAREIIDEFAADVLAETEPAAAADDGEEGTGVALLAGTQSLPAHQPVASSAAHLEGDASEPTQSTGNVGGSAGRSHYDSRLSTESPASVPVDTHSEPVSGRAGEKPAVAPRQAAGRASSDVLPAVAGGVHIRHHGIVRA